LNCKVGYDLPSTKSPRACSFGVGERFTNTSPGCKRHSTDKYYDMPSVFIPDHTTSTFTNHMIGKTYCFGNGREVFKN